MDLKQFHRRALVMVLLLALMLTGMGFTLYDLQINNGQEYYRQAQNKIAEQETVEAARGQILDRNGQVLVSNQVVYQVSLDTSLMKDNRNDILLSLFQISREEGVEEGICVFILDNLEEKVSRERILSKLERRFSLTPEQAEQYFEKYAKAEK